MKDLLSANMPLFAAFPALMAIVNLFFAKVAELFTILGQIDLILTGYAKDKNHVRTKVSNEALRLTGALESYADSVSNDVLFDEAHNCPSDFYNMRDDELGIHLQSILELGNANIGNLGPWGYTPVDLAAFATLVAEYNDWTQKPSEARIHRHELAMQAEALMREIEALMRRRLDGAMFIIRAAHPLVFSEYKASRRMIRTGSHKRKIAEEIEGGYLSLYVSSATDNVIIEGAKVFVDGELYEETDDEGETQDKLLTPGLHTVKVEMEGYVTYEGSVTIVKGEELSHEVTLELKPNLPPTEDESSGE